MVILKALEKRPENRWPTAMGMANALKDAYAGIMPDVTLSQEALDLASVPELADDPMPAIPPVVDQTAMIASTDVPRIVARPRRLRIRPYALLTAIALGGIIFSLLGIYAA